MAANKVDLETTQIQFGAKLTLDGKKEVFTGSGARTANQWLTREYRKPFVVPAEKDV